MKLTSTAFENEGNIFLIKNRFALFYFILKTYQTCSSQSWLIFSFIPPKIYLRFEIENQLSIEKQDFTNSAHLF